jgi:hypothetical protein
MALTTAFTLVKPTLGYVDWSVTGATCDTQQEVDLTEKGAPARFIRSGVVRVVDAGFTLNAGTATSITPRLTGVSGSAKAEDIVELDVGTKTRPTLVGGVLMRIPAGKLFLLVQPQASHATNDVSGRVWLEVIQ